jgi:uncharacterized protein
MSLQATIQSGIKEAMIKKDAVRLSVLRSLSALFNNELIAKGKAAGDTLSDDEALALVKRAVKQRKDSIAQFEKGGRPELAADEKAELAILETFLPAQMPRAEVVKIAEAKKQQLGVTDKSKLGALIGAVLKETKGQADGGMVKEVVESLFA